MTRRRRLTPSTVASVDEKGGHDAPTSRTHEVGRPTRLRAEVGDAALVRHGLIDGHSAVAPGTQRSAVVDRVRAAEVERDHVVDFEGGVQWILAQRAPPLLTRADDFFFVASDLSPYHARNSGSP